MTAISLTDPPPALKLFIPAVSSPLDLAPQLRLRDAFERFVVGSLIGIAKSTLGEYRRAVQHWEAYSANPPLPEITDDVCEEFFWRVRDSGLVRPATYNKWARHLRGILMRLGPRDSRNRRGKGLLPYVPLLPVWPEEFGDPRVIPLEDLSRIYEACQCARWPRGAEGMAATRWRAWLVLLYNCGPRRDDALGLTWANVESSPRGPVLKWRAKKTGKKQTVPLNTIVLRHLEKLPRGTETLIGFPNSHRDLYGEWKRILTLAGIHEGYTFHDVRRTCGTAYDLISERAAEWVLGHAKTVTRRSYINPDEKLFSAAAAIRQPVAFLR